ncbi:MAG: FAD-linked oxidase, partial [Gemmatimonadaceae bacterium]
MSSIAKSSVDAFKQSFSGRALTPEHTDYDQSRALWNGAIDRKPAIIAHCTTAPEVADAIRFANE